MPGKPAAEAYKPHPRRKIDVEKAPAPASRAAHGRALKRALDAAVAEAHQRRVDAGIQVHGAVPGLGLYVQFESQPGVPLKLSSLEDARQGIELVAFSYASTDSATRSAEPGNLPKERAPGLSDLIGETATQPRLITTSHAQRQAVTYLAIRTKDFAVERAAKALRSGGRLLIIPLAE
jgi:hypothetical protein